MTDKRLKKVGSTTPVVPFVSCLRAGALTASSIINNLSTPLSPHLPAIHHNILQTSSKRFVSSAFVFAKVWATRKPHPDGLIEFLLFSRAVFRDHGSSDFHMYKLAAKKRAYRLAIELSRAIKAFSGRIETRRAAVAVAVLFALPVFGVLTAFGVSSDTSTSTLPRQEVVQPVAMPAFEDHDGDAVTFRSFDRVQKGDSVAGILQRLGVDDKAAFEFLRTSKDARSIFQLRPGKNVQAVTDADGELQSLVYLHSPDKLLEVTRIDDRFRAAERVIVPSAQLVRKSATIRTSLFGATDGANIPDAVANQLARIFSTDIDFHVDLRTGDRFSVVYEMLYYEGEFLRPGRVISAEFSNKGKTFEAYLFTDSDGNDGYYAADGTNRAKSFLRSPLAFSRVSSGFGGRMHPIFRNWRQHTGVDFAAPKGTPTWATADGVVEFVGVKGGYGNVVEIRHSGSVTTLYAHLSGFGAGVRKGVRVNQGQTIGFVGATGFATGPHLHYEFKIAGQHQDPMRVALPKADPLAAKYVAQFKTTASTQAQQLALVRDSTFGRFE
jgi:murein DD-endopeptidase MepM/ murein hydrolase activator NlpD